LRLADLRALLNDYKRQVTDETRAAGLAGSIETGVEESAKTGLEQTRSRRFYHVASVRDVKIDELPVLLEEYKRLGKGLAASDSRTGVKSIAGVSDRSHLQKIPV
jgi:hypothetical protein